MKSNRIVLLFVSISLLALIAPRSSVAQFPEDALRFATPGLGVGARALGMGNAYTGVANDYSALFWNPAGLAQLEHGEFSFGLSHLNMKDNSNYFGTSNAITNNSTKLNALGLVFPVAVTRGSLVFAFGYNRENNFTTGVGLERQNIESVVQDWGMPRNPILAVDRDTVVETELGIAYELYLADLLPNSKHIWSIKINPQGQLDTTYAYVYDSPIKGRLTQIEKILQGGGINNWTAGAGVDIAKNLSAGISLSYQSGTYKFDRNYTEKDADNVYSSSFESDPRNFNSISIDEYVESDISGFSAKLGLMYRQPDRFRFGINIKTPTVFHVKERFAFGQNATFTSTPDFGEVSTLPAIEQTGEYEVVTPWIMSAGASIILGNLVLSGDIEYTDWTQLEFSEANADVIALNKTFKDMFRATMNLRGGAEYDFKEQGIRVRGGFIYNTSPYVIDKTSDFDQKYITAGLGFLLSEATMLDLTYARGWWKTTQKDYRLLGPIAENVGTNNFNLTFSYRF